MSLPPGAWTDIEHGVGPDLGRVREAVAGDRVVLGSQGVRDELGRVLRDTLGAGPLEGLLREPGVVSGVGAEALSSAKPVGSSISTLSSSAHG